MVEATGSAGLEAVLSRWLCSGVWSWVCECSVERAAVRVFLFE